MIVHIYLLYCQAMPPSPPTPTPIPWLIFIYLTSGKNTGLAICLRPSTLALWQTGCVTFEAFCLPCSPGPVFGQHVLTELERG